MARLQKFKLFATQCTVAGSPAQSPTASPVIHLRRRKTLRMLLNRNCTSGRRLPRCDDDSTDLRGDSSEKVKELVVSQKLKDLFVSSLPSEERASKKEIDMGEGFSRATACAGGVSDGGSVGVLGLRRVGNRSLRPLSGTFRQRLLRRAWRPVLVTIPE